MKTRRFRVSFGIIKNVWAVIPGLAVAWSPDGEQVLAFTFLPFYLQCHFRLRKSAEQRLPRAVRRAMKAVR